MNKNLMKSPSAKTGIKQQGGQNKLSINNDESQKENMKSAANIQ
mgnify:CR=1 FL=1